MGNELTSCCATPNDGMETAAGAAPMTKDISDPVKPFEEALPFSRTNATDFVSHLIDLQTEDAPDLVNFKSLKEKLTQPAWVEAYEKYGLADFFKSAVEGGESQFKVLGLMAFLWSKGTLEQKATQLVRVVHGGDGKKPVVGAKMLIDEFDILFCLATDFIIEEAIKSNNSGLKLDIKQLEANQILKAKINNGGKRFEQAKKIMILG